MSADDDHYARVTREYDELATHGPLATLAPGNRGGRKSEYVTAVFDAALRPWLRHLQSTDHVLDFGCGTGILTRQIAARAGHVTGIDISPGVLQWARETCRELDNVTLLQTDGIELVEFPSASFDWAVARESLCYVPDEQMATLLAEIHRILKPGAAFILLDQFSNNPRWISNPAAPDVLKRPPQLVRTMAAQAGLVVVEETKIRSPRFPWIFPIWFGLFPRRSIPTLARWEVRWHRQFPHATRRWWNAVFVLRKPING
jgi:SAM-dependent methyltransferase